MAYVQPMFNRDRTLHVVPRMPICLCTCFAMPTMPVRCPNVGFSALAFATLSRLSQPVRLSTCYKVATRQALHLTRYNRLVLPAHLTMCASVTSAVTACPCIPPSAFVPAVRFGFALRRSAGQAYTLLFLPLAKIGAERNGAFFALFRSKGFFGFLDFRRVRPENHAKTLCNIPG